MGLIADLGRGPVGLDTAVFIYFIEEHPRFLPVVAPVFSPVASARLKRCPPPRTPFGQAAGCAPTRGSTERSVRAHLTNDRSLPRIPGLEILQVKDYAASA